MKKISSLLVILLFTGMNYLHAQVAQRSSHCSTPNLDSATAKALPYYGNNQVIENYLIQNGYNSLPYISFPSLPQARTMSTTFLQPNFLIPVNIYIYRNGANDPNSSITENQARNYVCEANEIFRNAGTAIQFYTNRVEFESNNFFNNEMSTDLHAYDLWSRKRYNPDPSKGINVHFVRFNDGSPGVASLPQYSIPYSDYSLFVMTHNAPFGGQRTDIEITATLAHELGHTLGLLHTHHPGRFASAVLNSEDGEGNGTIKNGCYQESVSRVKRNYWYDGCFGTDNKLKCEINGDFLCDTQADPRQSGNVTDCTYNLPASGDFREDNWGAIWTPPTHNVMAYTESDCRTEFSRSQTGIMWMEMLDFKSFINYQDPTIVSANGPLCTSPRSFSLQGTLPNDAQVTWEVFPSSLVKVSSGVGLTANISAANSNDSGQGKIVFTLVGPGNCYIARLQKEFWIGTPVFTAYTFDGEMAPVICEFGVPFTGGEHVLYAVPGGGGTTGYPNFTLQTTSPYVRATKVGYNYNISVSLKNQNFSFTVRASASNACGTKQTCTFFSNFPVSIMLEPYPNPSDSETRVKLGNEGDLKSVSLYNSSSVVVFTTETTDNEVTLATSTLPEGMYVLRITTKGKTTSRHLKVKH